VNTSFPFHLAGGQLIGEARTAISPDSGPLRTDRVRPEHLQAQAGSDRIIPDQTGSGRVEPEAPGRDRIVPVRARDRRMTAICSQFTTHCLMICRTMCAL